MAVLGRKPLVGVPDRSSIPIGLGLGVSAGMVFGAVGLIVALAFVGLLRFRFNGVDSGGSSSHIAPATTFEARHPDQGPEPSRPLSAAVPHRDGDSEEPRAAVHPFVVHAGTGGLKVRHNRGAADTGDSQAETKSAGTEESPAAGGTAVTVTAVNDGADSRPTAGGEPSLAPADAQAARARQEADDTADNIEAEAARARQAAQDSLDAGRGTQADLDRAIMLEAQEQMRAQRLRDAAATAEIQAQARNRNRRTRLAGTGNR